MKVLNGLFVNGHGQKMPIIRIFATIVLTCMMFVLVGFLSSGQASAHSNTSSACGDVTSTSDEIIGYFGTYYGQVYLIQNTCTNLYHAEAVCSIAAPLTVQLLSFVAGQETVYSAINTTCAAGQTFDTGSHAYVPRPNGFCAVAIATSAGDGGSGKACIFS